MNTDDKRVAVGRVFREITLSLISLFQIYDVNSDLNQATADVLRQLFRKHTRETPSSGKEDYRSPLHILVDEMERTLGIKPGGRRKQ